jgi:superfamily II DNA or RNA helicase
MRVGRDSEDTMSYTGQSQDQIRLSLHAALMRLVEADQDFATEENQRGFGRVDGQIGHALANQDPLGWSPKQTKAAYNILQRYKNTQLPLFGIDFNQIDTPEEPIIAEARALLAREVPGESLAQRVARLHHDKAPTQLPESRIQLDEKEGRIVFHYPREDPDFDEKLAAVKAIPGRRWHTYTKTWNIPVTASTITFCTELVVKYLDAPSPFIMDDATTYALEEAMHLIESTLRSSYAEHTDYEVEGLREGMALYPFQKAGVKFIIDHKHVILADDMGLGKTPQCIAAVVDQAAWPVLVICPSSLKLNWKREFERWVDPMIGHNIRKGDRGGHSLIIQVAAGKKAPAMREPIDVLIVNYDIVEAWLPVILSHRWEAIICDEAHYLKNNKAKRTKAVKDLVKAQQPEYTVLATGTPFLSRPIEGWTLIQMIGKGDVFGGWMGYTQQYCNPPEAPIWMGDFSFRPLGSVRVGDEVIGWAPKEGKKGTNRQSLTRSFVTGVTRRHSPIVRVTTESGRSFRCTPDHKWLSATSDFGVYVTPKLGRNITHVVDPVYGPPFGCDRLSAWLGGMYDGEGTGTLIAQSPSHNPVIYSAIGSALGQLDLPYTNVPNGVTLTGGRQAAVRFVNYCQPLKRGRWIDRRILTGRFRNPDRIVSVEPDGEGEVIALTTSTGNYVAWGFASRNCDAKPGFGGSLDVSGASNTDDLNRVLRSSGAMVRRRKVDVLKELPSRTWATVPLEMSKAGAKAYVAAEQDVVGFYADLKSKDAALQAEWRAQAEEAYRTDDRISPADAWVDAYVEAKRHEYRKSEEARLSQSEQLLRWEALKQVAYEAKKAAVFDWIDTFLESEEKLVIFANHRATVLELAERYNAPTIMGGQKVEDIEKGKDRFQNDPHCRVLVANIKAGGVGHTLTAASNVAFVELGWTPAEMDQALDRTHRIGQDKPVTGWVLVAELPSEFAVTATTIVGEGWDIDSTGKASSEVIRSAYQDTSTIDGEIDRIIAKKRKVVDSATDGDGVENQVSVMAELRKRLDRRKAGR